MSSSLCRSEVWHDMAGGPDQGVTRLQAVCPASLSSFSFSLFFRADSQRNPAMGSTQHLQLLRQDSKKLGKYLGK